MSDKSGLDAAPAEPVADRPHMPEGYLMDRVLPWSWAEARLLRARSYWIGTVTPSGHPHSRPVWGLWLDGAVYFSTGPSRIRKNLQHSAHVSVNLESADECLIVEGSAVLERSLEALTRVVAAYTAKYGWEMEANPGEWFRVQPHVAFAWIVDSSGEDRGVLFSKSATRWKF